VAHLFEEREYRTISGMDVHIIVKSIVMHTPTLTLRSIQV
jgi:hypothetical protein